MAHSFTKHAELLLNASNVSELIILSFSLQAFLILFARFRKEGIGRKRFIRWSIWLAYLFSEKVAAYTTVRIISSNRRKSTSTGPPTDILLFWASFLLLHVGGPDDITSFAQEDNDLWKRHLLWLLLRVFLTLKAFLSSFSKNKLRLPTILVLFVGITKCAERIFALHRARFAHFAMYWVSIKVNMGDDKQKGKMRARLSIPAQFKGVEELESTLGIAVRLFSNLKRALVGPLLTREGQDRIKKMFRMISSSKKARQISSSKEALQVLKIELSLLFELLHTKLPVIDSKGGFCLRMANYGCIFLALVLFSLAKRHYQLGEFDLLLTYGLLIGALALDFLSITLLFKHSDWLAISHFQESNEKKVIERKVIARQDRWSNEVPQLNFITYHVKDMPVWLNKLVDVRDLRSLVKDIKGICCQSSHSLDKEDGLLWRFIYYVLETFSKDTVKKIKATWLGSGRKLLDAEQGEIIDNLDYTKSLLVWHIVTELCYHEDDQYKPETDRDYRLICKVFSDYMFYLAIMQPDMMATVLDNWNTVFRKTLNKIRKVVPWSFFLNQKTASRKFLYMEQGNGNLNYDTCLLQLGLQAGLQAGSTGEGTITGGS